MIAQTNPFDGATFFSFFGILLSRLGERLQGLLSWNQLVDDELQLLVLIGVAMSSALVGSFLVLRKMTMLANSLSHTILLGIVIAFLLAGGGVLAEESGYAVSTGSMLFAAVITAIFTTLLTEFFTHALGLQEDASMGIVFTTLFALGIVLVTLLTRQAHIGTEVVMGNVDGLQIDDLKLVYFVLLLNLVTIGLFYKEMKVTTFDSSFSESIGIFASRYNLLLMLLVAMTTMSAFRAVGVLMVLAFMTAPVLAARFVTHCLTKLIYTAMGIGIMGSLIGVALSRHLLTSAHLALSTGGLTVTVLGVLFIVILLLSRSIDYQSHAQKG